MTASAPACPGGVPELWCRCLFAEHEPGTCTSTSLPRTWREMPFVLLGRAVRWSISPRAARGGPGSREAKQSQTARIQRGNKGITHPEVAYAVYFSRKHVVRSALSQRATEGKSAPQHEKETWPRGIQTPNCKVCARLLEWYLPESQLSTAVRSRGEISTLWKPSFNGRKRVLL